MDKGIDMRKPGERHPTPRHTASAYARPLGFRIAVALAVVTAVVACAFLYRAYTVPPAERDPNAALGQLDGKTPEEIQAELNRVVEEGMFNVSISSTVSFEDGEAEGELRIENVPGNRYLMKVQITADGTGEVLYTSGLIEPNHHIERARLDVDMEAGTYPCTAVFYAYEPDTEESVGQAAVKMTITVAH